jgi:hypothetical protein
MIKNIQEFCEKRLSGSDQVIIGVSQMSGKIPPKDKIELVFCLFSNSRHQFFSDNLQIEVMGSPFQTIPIGGTFWGQRFELLETQIYLRTFGEGHRVLTFKRSETAQSHTLKFQNLTADSLKLYFGIFATFDEIINQWKRPVSGQGSARGGQQTMAQPTADLQVPHSGNSGQSKHELEARTLNKRQLLLHLVGKEVADELVLKSNASTESFGNSNRMARANSSRLKASAPPPPLQAQFSQNLEDGTWKLSLIPSLARAAGSSFLLQTGEAVVGPQKILEFKVSCSHATPGDEAVLLVSDAPLGNNNHSYIAVQLKEA